MMPQRNERLLPSAVASACSSYRSRRRCPNSPTGVTQRHEEKEASFGSAVEVFEFPYIVAPNNNNILHGEESLYESESVQGAGF